MKYPFKPYLLILSVLPILTASCSKKSTNPAPQNGNGTPVITSLDITSGPYNATVTINGSGFSSDWSKNTAFFNGKPAVIDYSYSTKIIAHVPLEAGTGKVSVSIDNGAPVYGPVFTYQPSLVVITFAGSLNQPGFKDGKGEEALFAQLDGMAIDKSGNLYVADQSNLVIRKITPQGDVTTFAGSGKQGRSDGTTATATFEGPNDVTVDKDGNVFVSDAGVLRKITNDGKVSTINPLQIDSQGYLLGSNPRFTGITVDASDNLYFTDRANQFIGKVTPDGKAVVGISGNRSPGTDGTIPPRNFVDPEGIKLDNNGNLFITDRLIWKVDAAHELTQYSMSGLSDPRGLAFDNNGNLFVANAVSALITKTTSDGVTTTFAGTAGNGIAVNGVVNKATFVFPTGIAVDASGNIFVADARSIREITVK